MIFGNYSFRSKCYLVIIFAFIIQYLYLWVRQQDNIVINEEAHSAIKRAKTDICRREIREFVIKSSSYQRHPPTYLKRSCPLDTKERQFIRLGCVSNDSVGLVPLEESDPIECLDRCFNYGHSYGGLNGNQCHCGDVNNDVYFNATKQCLRDEVDLYRVDNGIYYPRTNLLLNQIPNRNERLKIAFLLSLNGRYTSQVRRLLKSIYSPNHIYYIHVDPREDHLFKNLFQLELKYANIILARSRFETIWGGPRLLTMMLDAMRNLADRHWDYMINLSESDFPIKNITELEHYLATHGRFIYLRKHNMRGYNFIKKQGLEWYFYQCENRAWRLGKRQLPRGIVFTGGSDWFALPKEFCNHILETMNDEQGLVKPLLDMYNYTLLPAESFFHTLALNGKYCDKIVDNNLRMTNWQRKQGCKCQHKNVVDWCGCSPLVYRWSDWGRLQRSNSLKSIFFSRKFEPTISSSIINAVEQYLVYDNQQAPRTDTRFWFLAPHSLKRNPYLENFARLSVKQVANSSISTIHIQEDVHLYFNQDRFVGLIIGYCDMQTNCGQILIENEKDSQVVHYNQSCLSEPGRQLKAIEINQGFDTGERMFRSYLPLNINSDIVVYHEWLIQGTGQKLPNTTDKIKFVWTSPLRDDNELTQDVKLRSSSKLKRLSLVHRMNVKKPIAPDLWTMSLMINEKLCLRYQFFVLGSSNYTTNQSVIFNRFYKVTNYCTSSDLRVDEHPNTRDCRNHEWSLENMRASDELYGLN